MERGRFITIEGIEGVGKSTNMAYVVELLEARGITVVQTREPGGTPLAENVRELLLAHREENICEITESLLMFAARAQNVANTIEPALAAGHWVVCDRFTDASRAYQGGGRGLPMTTIEQLAAWVHPELEPDLTLLLDATVELGMTRAGDRGESDRIEKEKQEFFHRVRATYLELAEEDPGRFAVIDASQSLEQVRTAVRESLNRIL